MTIFLIKIFWLHYNEVAENTKIIAGNIFHGIMTTIIFVFIKTE